MDASNLVLIVVAIPLVLAIGIALPFIADRDTARAFSPSRQLDRAPLPAPISGLLNPSRASSAICRFCVAVLGHASHGHPAGDLTCTACPARLHFNPTAKT